jgi:hypothetical protein
VIVPCSVAATIVPYERVASDVVTSLVLVVLVIHTTSYVLKVWRRCQIVETRVRVLADLELVLLSCILRVLLW